MTIYRKTIGLVGALVITFCAVATAAERFRWLTDLGEARALASEQGKPLLIVFRCEP